MCWTNYESYVHAYLYHSGKSLERHCHSVQNPMYLGGAFQARVHLCTLGYMRVAGQLWLLLKTVKQLAGTIKATMAQVICTMGF